MSEVSSKNTKGVFAAFCPQEVIGLDRNYQEQRMFIDFHYQRGGLQGGNETLSLITKSGQFAFEREERENVEGRGGDDDMEKKEESLRKFGITDARGRG